MDFASKTVLGTLLSVLVTSTMAYAVSKVYVPGMKLHERPHGVYHVISRRPDPHSCSTCRWLIRTYWVMVLPLWAEHHVLHHHAQLLFLLRAPQLEDAARIDGCNDVRVFFRVILPLSKPMLAAVSLFIAVGFWNDYYSYMMYIATKPTPFAWVLRRVRRPDHDVADAHRRGGYRRAAAAAHGGMATIICAMLPIMCVYPFLQKHFAKGVLIGAVKE